MCGSLSGIDKEFSLLGYDAVLFDKYRSFEGDFCLHLQCQNGCKKQTSQWKGYFFSGVARIFWALSYQ